MDSAFSLRDDFLGVVLRTWWKANLKKIAWIVLGCFIFGVAVFAVQTGVFRTRGETPSDPPTPKTLALEIPPGQPLHLPSFSPVRFFWDIYGLLPENLDTQLQFIKTEDQLVSLWFQSPLEIGGSKLFLVLTQLQALDPEGDVITEKSQSIQLGGALYQFLEDGSLDLLLAQDQLGEFGQGGHWDSPQNPQWLDIGPLKKSLVLPLKACNQGECSTESHLLEVSLSQLGFIGSAVTAESNTDQCDHSHKNQCFEYDSQIHSLADSGKDYFDLEVLKTGKELNGKNQIVEAKSEKLIFQDGRYEPIVAAENN